MQHTKIVKSKVGSFLQRKIEMQICRGPFKKVEHVLGKAQVIET